MTCKGVSVIVLDTVDVASVALVFVSISPVSLLFSFPAYRVLDCLNFDQLLPPEKRSK